LSAGSIAGIAIGGTLAILLIAALSFFFRRHKRLRDEGTSKGIDDARHYIEYCGDQRPIHRPSELELNTRSVRSYPSTQEIADTPKRWEVVGAVELDATEQR
jgi:hypothetical protein